MSDQAGNNKKNRDAAWDRDGVVLKNGKLHFNGMNIAIDDIFCIVKKPVMGRKFQINAAIYAAIFLYSVFYLLNGFVHWLYLAGVGISGFSLIRDFNKYLDLKDKWELEIYGPFADCKLLRLKDKESAVELYERLVSLGVNTDKVRMYQKRKDEAADA